MKRILLVLFVILLFSGCVSIKKTGQAIGGYGDGDPFKCGTITCTKGATCCQSGYGSSDCCDGCSEMCEAGECVPSGKRFCKGKCNLIQDCYCISDDDCIVDDTQNSCTFSYCDNGLCRDDTWPDGHICDFSDRKALKKCCNGSCCPARSLCTSKGCMVSGYCFSYPQSDMEEIQRLKDAAKGEGCFIDVYTEIKENQETYYGICLRCI